MSWTVIWENEAQMRKQLTDHMKSGAIDQEDIKLLKIWIALVEKSGPSAVLKKRWNDHPLDKEWKGYRSAAFSPAGRIIYRVVDNKLLVVVVRITPTHNYER